MRERGRSATAPGPEGLAPRARLALSATLVLVAALVAAAHWPVLGARALAFDDSAFVTRNPLVTHPGWPSVGRFFREVLNPSTVRGYYLPLSMTSLMLDYAAGGRPDDLRVFHRTSLALHVLNAALIVLILHRLFGALIPAALAGLAFGLHPLTVEPVAWISERKTLLATSLALACVLCYLEYCRLKSRSWLHAALALDALALLSKPTVTPLPLMLLILDYWPLKRLRAQTVAEKWPFLLLSLLSGTITVVSHQHTAGIGQTDYLLWPLRAGYLLAFYLGKIVWPADLSCVYQLPAPFTLSNPTVGLAVLGVCVLTILLVRLARRVPGPLAGWSCFVLALAPTLGVVSYSWVLASDKYVYFPALGILISLTSGLATAWGSPRSAGIARKAALLLPAVALLALEARGVRETLRHWTDSLTLYRHVEQVAPDAPAVHAQLGVLLERAGAHDEAVLQLRRALVLEPNYPDAHYNLGVALAARGQLDESIDQLRTADVLLPDDPPTVYNLGLSLRRAGRLEEAADQFRRLLRLKPDDLAAANELGGVLVAQGRVAEAVDQFRGALALAPTSAHLHYRLAGALLLGGGDASEARDHLRRAAQLDPRWPSPFNDLAWLLATSSDSSARDPEEAVRLAERAVALTGGRDPRLLDTRAAAEAAAGRFEAAVATERRAIELAARTMNDTLVAGLRQRMALYRRHTAYLEPGHRGGPRR